MDWFRWHHGSVTDPKFQLVAKKAGASVAEVLAVWACLLEAASMAEKRGNPGECDFESLDCGLGLPDGKARAIYEQMSVRGVVSEDGQIAAWDRRQPKREDETANDRKRRQRERDHDLAVASHDESRDVTQGHARGDKRREEVNTPPTPQGGMPGFDSFWAAWPKSDRKQAKGKCLEAWKKAKAEADAALIVAHVEHLKTSAMWTKDGGQFVPAPLVYLNNRRWEGADAANDHDPYGIKKAL